MAHPSLARIAFLLLTVVSSVLAVHIPRDVSPLITQPDALTTWTLGTVESVTWTTSGSDLDGVKGTFLMGFAFTNGTIQLWKDQPLATDVALADGIVNVRCPLNLPTSFRYVVALVGSENNTSPPFQVLDINNHDVGSMIDISTLPVALSTLGSIPPATVTRTSVVATIPPASSTSPPSSTSGTSGTAQVTGTKKQGTDTNGALSLKEGSWHISLILASGLFMAIGSLLA